MGRALSLRAVKVLTLLEGARATARARTFGEWVPTGEFVDGAGINFKVGLIELHHKRLPDKGAGFIIERKKQEIADDFQYRIVKYPIGWKGWRDYNDQMKGVSKDATIEKAHRLRRPRRGAIRGTQLGMFPLPQAGAS